MASSIPLPALAIQPPRHTDMAQKLSQMVNLANAMRQAQFQAQMQPLQLQQQQAVQLQAQQLRDVQAPRRGSAHRQGVTKLKSAICGLTFCVVTRYKSNWPAWRGDLAGFFLRPGGSWCRVGAASPRCADRGMLRHRVLLPPIVIDRRRSSDSAKIV